MILEIQLKTCSATDGIPVSYAFQCGKLKYTGTVNYPLAVISGGLHSWGGRESRVYKCCVPVCPMQPQAKCEQVAF